MSGIIPNTPGPPERPASFRIGDWLVEPALGRVSRDRVAVHLRPQLMDLAVVFARQPGSVISKDELFASVWPDQTVAESALARCVAELRQVFGDDARLPRVIETIPKRGYRLVAPVTAASSPGTPEQTGPACREDDHGIFAALADGTTRLDTSPSLVTAAAPAPQPQDEHPAGAPEPPPVPTRGGRRPLHWIAIAAVSLLVGVATFAITVRFSRSAAPLERIILTDFDNRTSDAGLDSTLQLALAVYLQREPSFEILSDGAGIRPRATPDEGDTSSAAGTAVQEVCTIQQGAAVVHGSIVSLGVRYALGLEATSCRSGAVLTRELVEARSKDEVLDALEKAAASLRRKLALRLEADRRSRTTRLALHAGAPGPTDAATER